MAVFSFSFTSELPSFRTSALFSLFLKRNGFYRAVFFCCFTAFKKLTALGVYYSGLFINYLKYTGAYLLAIAAAGA